MRLFKVIQTRQRIIFTLAIICLVLISSGLSEISFKSGSLADQKTIDEVKLLFNQLGNLQDILLIVTILVVIIVFVFTFLRSSNSYVVQKPKKIKIPIYFYLFLWVLLFVVFRRKVLFNKILLELPQQIQSTALFDRNVPESSLHPFSAWLSFGLSFLLILTIILIVGLLWKHPIIHKNVLKEISRFTEEAIEELQGGGDYKDVILRCYSEMCQVLYKNKGLKRSRHMTAREFERKLISSGLPPIPVQKLTVLFEGARYGNTHANLEQQTQAIDCLKEIREACGD